MSSWRDAADPHCPECDGPLSSTASFCMHCGVDLPDDSADVSDADDVSLSGTGPDRDRDRFAGVLAALKGRKSTGPATADVERSVPQVERGSPGVKESNSVKSPLWLRLPIAVVIAIPVTFVATMIVLGLVGRLSGEAGFLVLAGGWVATTAYLVRKPVPSDILGDAFFVLAALILIGPAFGYLSMMVQSVVYPGAIEDSIPALAVELVVVEVLAAFPASFFALLGAAGNWWAARKLEGAGTEQTTDGPSDAVDGGD